MGGLDKTIASPAVALGWVGLGWGWGWPPPRRRLAWEEGGRLGDAAVRAVYNGLSGVRPVVLEGSAFPV